jgi:hypothetical protein
MTVYLSHYQLVNPWIGVDKVVAVFEKVTKRGQILEYLPFKNRDVQVPWIHKPTAV